MGASTHHGCQLDNLDGTLNDRWVCILSLLWKDRRRRREDKGGEMLWGLTVVPVGT